MKICLINNLYKPYAVGGAEQVMQRRVEEYAAQGHDVRVITWHPWAGYGSWRPEEDAQGEIIIYRYWVPNIFSYVNLSKHNFLLKLIWHSIDIFNFWSESIIKKVLLIEKPDIVETHNLMGIGVYKVHKILKSIKSEAKWIHYLHDVQLVEPSGVLPWNHKQDNWYQKIYSWLMIKRMGDPDIIISPSDFLKDFYQSRGFFKKSEWQVEKLKVESLKSKVVSERPQFLFVGSLVEHKGIRVLMKAWNSVCHCEESADEAETKQSQASLHIVGTGILASEVRKWANKNSDVKVHGRLENEELERVYRESDVLIFPSICLENRPTVILEAQRHGLEIIASNTGGVKEILDGYKRGTLIVPQDVDILTKAIKSAII